MTTDTEFRQMIARNNYVIVDTETTGLPPNRCEICEVAIIDLTGLVLLNTRVKTIRPIPFDATRIHGINDHDVAGCPTWAQLVPAIKLMIAGKDVITYKAKFDRQMFHLSDDENRLGHIEWETIATWHCAMLWYADIWREWDDRRHKWAWQKLGNAMIQQGLTVSNAHSALGDAEMTRQLIKAVIAKPHSFVTEGENIADSL